MKRKRAIRPQFFKQIFDLRRALLCLFIAGSATGWAGFVLPASAQNPAPVVVNGIQYESVAGRDARGPYWLAWRGIRAGSETVERGGSLLRRGTDYFFDANAGTLAFASDLTGSETVHVSYRADTPQSARNEANASVTPLDYDLWTSGANRVSLHSYLDPKRSAGANAPVSLLQWAGSYRENRHSDFASAFYLDLHGGDWMGRSGIRLSQRSKSKTSDLGFTYTRAGAQFAAPQDSGLQTGTEVFQAQGKFSPEKGLSLLASLKQTTLLPGDGGTATGGVTRNAVGSVSYLLPDGKVEAGRDITQSVAADGSQIARTQDSAKLETAVAPKTTATAQFESQAAQSSSKDDSSTTYAQKTQVGFRTNFWKPLTLSGSFRNALGTNGGQDAANLKMEAAPFAALRDLRVTANLEDRYRDTGTERLREGMLELPPLPFGKLKLSGGFRQTYSPDAERWTGLINAEFAPLPFVEISGNSRLRSGTLANNQPDPAFSDGYQVKVALAPVKRFRLTGNMSRNPDQSDGNLKQIASQTFGLETEIGSFGLRGQTGLDNEYLANRLTRTMGLDMSLRLSRYDTLTTGYIGRYLDGTGLSGSATYLFGYTRRMGSAFDLSLTGKMIRNDGDSVSAADRLEYKAEAKLGVRF